MKAREFIRHAAAIGRLAIGAGLAAVLASPPLLAQDLAQDKVAIRVDANATLGPFKPMYAYFGYDEPNFTYMANGAS
jgi:hypothetical protein